MNIRTTKPTSNNKFYITTSKGGYSTCIQGSPTDLQCNVLANCVGYACGRFNEIIGSMKYPGLNCNAENFIERAKNLGLTVAYYPTLGGIMVWQKGNTLNSSDGAGHLAIVERIDSYSQIYTSESSYGNAAFYNVKRGNANKRWSMSSDYAFRGCIINPAIGDIHYTETISTSATTQPSIELAHNVGEIVAINGVYSNSNSDEKLAPAIKQGIITKVLHDTKNPYLLDNGNIGWVNDSCIVSASAQNAITKTVANCSMLNLRTTSNYGNNIYKTINVGIQVEYLGMKNGWAKIRYEGKTLYCGNKYLK